MNVRRKLQTRAKGVRPNYYSEKVGMLNWNKKSIHSFCFLSLKNKAAYFVFKCSITWVVPYQ